MSADPLVIAATAFATALAATALVRRYALRRLVDAPNARSSHAVPTPRGGGMGLVLGVGAAMAALAASGGWGWPLPALLACLLAMALLGWWDDHASLSARLRLAVQVLLVTAVAFLVGPPRALALGGWRVAIPPLVAISVLSLGGAWMVNLTNFMDGIDGLAGTQAVIASGYAAALLLSAAEPGSIAALVGWTALATSAASAGFLCWNWPRARIFMGDVGSTYLGLVFTAQVIALLDCGQQLDVALLPLFPFIADASCTLVRRACRRERLSTAHRTHLYQRLAQAWGHLPVTLLYAGMALAGVAGADLTRRGIMTSGAALALLSAGFCALAASARVRT